ncbi:efflux RND transporter periplasmic adaptor subunit [Novosphingobium huizhouense]|uniref:efflux RND transporter periplasmic adaptor subunit n=1 Tax=Novosphingobium huizhouense TaxID=2866625 RepID=UPI001CD9146A|nr:efflux RND transporter periplasmic adaptor subunit [Novosphingobium huizhouense]
MAIGASRGQADAPAAAAGKGPTPVRAVTIGGVDGGDGAGAAGAAGATPWGESFAATIHREREATLSFRLPGRLGSSPPREGARLGAGAVVASIDATPWRAALVRAQAEEDRLSRAAARYATLAPDGAVSDAQAKDARDALAAARAAVAAARYDLSSATLTMPFAGVVLSRRAEIGETVAGGQAVAMVADLSSPLIATAQLPAGRAAGLRPGAAAQVLVPAMAQPLAARVIRIGAASDPRAGTVAVDLALVQPPALPSGLSASVRFAREAAAGPAAGAASATLADIPAEAILDAEGARAFVYVIDRQSRARRVEVRFAGFDDRTARVAGLPRGARVITAGAGFVAEGEAVRVTGE